MRTLIIDTIPVIVRDYEAFKFTTACEAILSIAARGNLYLQETTPWTTFKKVQPSEISLD